MCDKRPNTSVTVFATSSSRMHGLVTSGATKSDAVTAKSETTSFIPENVPNQDTTEDVFNITELSLKNLFFGLNIPAQNLLGTLKCIKDNDYVDLSNFMFSNEHRTSPKTVHSLAEWMELFMVYETFVLQLKASNNYVSLELCTEFARYRWRIQQLAKKHVWAHVYAYDIAHRQACAQRKQSLGIEDSALQEKIFSPQSDIKDPNIVVKYLKKMKGHGRRPAYDNPIEALISLLISFTGILVLTGIDHLLKDTEYTQVTGSFGAAAVLVFCSYKVPASQPRSVFFGQLIGALCGMASKTAFGPQYDYMAGAIAVSTTIALQMLTNTVHPPGGASALLAVYASPKVQGLGFLYILTPVAVGALIMVIVAVLLNNLSPTRQYPTYWL